MVQRLAMIADPQRDAGAAIRALAAGDAAVGGAAGTTWHSSSGTTHVRAWSVDPTDEHGSARWVSGSEVLVAGGRERGRHCRLVLDPAGDGALSQDPFGLHGLYTTAIGSTVVYGDDARVVAFIGAAIRGEPVRKNAEFAAWIAMAGFPVGNATGFADVRALDGEVAVSFVDGVATETRATPAYAEPLDGSEHALLDHADSALLEGARAALVGDGPFRAELTGGKDSRLVLALLARAGCADVEFFTRGPKTTADAVAATALAEAGGLSHTMRRWRVDGNYHDGLLRHVHRTNGEINCRDMSAPSTFAGSTFSGFAGEVLRTNWVGEVGIASYEAASNAFASMPFGAAELVDPEAAVRALGYGLDTFERPHTYDPRPEDLFDIFYIDHRLRRWVSARTERFSDNVFLLYDREATRAAFSLPWQQRVSGQIHTESIARAGEQIAGVPYAKEGHIAVMKTPNAAEQAGASDRVRSGKPDQLRFSGTAAGTVPDRVLPAGRVSRDLSRRRGVMRELVAANPHSPAWEILDRERLIAAIDRLEELSHRAVVEVHGALTAVIWLGDLEVESVDQ